MAEPIENEQVIKELKKIHSSMAGINKGFQEFFKQDKTDRLKSLDPKESMMTRVSNLAGGAGASMAGAGVGLGGILGGLGGLFKGFGSGLAVAGLGLAGALVGVFLMAQMLDARKIRENVKELINISDDFDGKTVEFFSKSGTFFASMTGIGVGLAALGIGSTIAGVGTAIAEWAKPNWVGQIKENVKELLSIQDLFDNGSIEMWGRSGAFFLSMSGIGLGLAAFGIGSAIGGAGTGVAEAVSKFQETGNWAENIKEKVETLLSIPALTNATLGNVAGFIGIMGGLAAGLTAFAAGAVFSSAGNSVAAFMGVGSGNVDWAQIIKDRVETLLSIPDLPNATLGNFAEFELIMLGIAAGLTAFAASGVFVSAGDAVSNFITGVQSGENDWTNVLKKRVKNILSLVNENDFNISKAEEFTRVMGLIAGGLGKFAVGSIGTAIANFFTGKEESPFKHLIDLIDRQEKISKTAESIRELNDAFKGKGQAEYIQELSTRQVAAERLVGESVTNTAYKVQPASATIISSNVDNSQTVSQNNTAALVPGATATDINAATRGRNGRTAYAI